MKDFCGETSYELKHLKYFQRIISRLSTERVGDYHSKHYDTSISEKNVIQMTALAGYVKHPYKILVFELNFFFLTGL